MKHDFRLRRAKEVRVLTSEKTAVTLKVVYGASLLAILSSVVSLGILFLNFDRYLNFGLEAPASITEKKETPKYDKYGGWKKIKGEARGVFSIQEINGMQSLVTPDGNTFFMASVNKVWPWSLDDQAFKEKYNNSTIRWAKEIAPFLDSLHFNIGNQSELTALRHRTVLRLPFVVQAQFVDPESADRSEPEDFPDVWSPEYDTKAYAEAERIGRIYGNDPYLIMVQNGNELNFNLQRSDGSENSTSKWWWMLLSAEGETPAKDHWEALMAERYNNDIASLNAVYATSLTSFEELSDLGLSLFDRFDTIEEGEGEDAEKSYSDIDDFNTDIAEQFHKVNQTYLRQFMPKVIIGSERLVQGNHSEQYFTKVGPTIDVLLFNQYLAEGSSPRSELIDDYATLAGKPVAITEHTYAMAPCGVSDDGGNYPEVADQPSRATAHLTWRNGFVNHPKVLGFGWHELNDFRSETNTCGYSNFGLRDRQDNPYQEMIDAGKAGWEDYNELRWKIGTVGNTNATRSRGPLDPLTNTTEEKNLLTNATPKANPSTNATPAANRETDTEDQLNPDTDTGEGFEPETSVAEDLKPLETSGGVAKEVPTVPMLTNFFSGIGRAK